VIDSVRPTIVYTHSLHDVHQDHRNTHRAVMAAAREIGSVFCFQSPSATVDFRPARFTSIDAQLTVKLAAIGAFASQVALRWYLEPDLIEATARYWSRFGRCRHAEAFEVARDQGTRRGRGRAAPAAEVPGATISENGPDDGRSEPGEIAARQILEGGHVNA
jgi:LmbE family N-acetylglucosaminyl deacetylase